MCDGDTQKIYTGAAAEQAGKRQEHPRKVGRRERKKAKETHSDVFVSSPPQVHHHKGQRVPKEMDRNERCSCQHAPCAKQKHDDEVCCPSTKGSLFQQPAVTHQKVHVKHELEAEEAEKKEIRHQPPNLSLVKYELKVEV